MDIQNWAGSKSTTRDSAVVQKVKKVKRIQGEESEMTYMR